MFNIVRLLLPLAFLLGLTACLETEQQTQKNNANEELSFLVQLDVFKSPTCQCCDGWVSHAKQHGFISTTHHPLDLNELKSIWGVAPQYQSCHTAVSKEGYVFEGHIPAQVIQRFLAEKPANALGLAVPGMPIGSPGMEMGDRRDDYDVLLLKKDGGSQVYARIRANS